MKKPFRHADTKRTKRAVALKYDVKEDVAPKVTAKGEGYVAQKIIELAKKYNLPIREDPELVYLLSSIELNENIPTELYRIVAEVLAMIYKVNGKLE